MTISDPTHVDYNIFPPGMLMSINALSVRLLDTIGDPDIAIWRKTLEIFASATGMPVQCLPDPGATICLRIGDGASGTVRNKGKVLNWLSISPQVQSLQGLGRSHARGPGLTLYIHRASAAVTL